MTIDIKGIFIMMGEVLLIIAGLLYIITAVIEGIHIIKNIKDMPINVIRFPKEKYKVIDKEKFNSIMIIKNTLICVVSLLTGFLCVFFRSPLVCFILPLPVLINIICSNKAKKYLGLRSDIT